MTRVGGMTMTASVKLGVAMLLALGLVAAITGDGWAGAPPTFLVQIDDLTDSITLTLSPAFPGAPLPPNPTIRPDSVGEFLHFTLPLSFVTPATSLLSRDLLEGAGGPVSDRLLITHAANSLILDVQFASDPATITLPTGVLSIPPLVESGIFQTMLIFSDGPLLGYEFQVRSDLASSERGDVPAPATLLLLGSGLAALAGAARRRRRK
jgi:PEP-CTERM motif